MKIEAKQAGWCLTLDIGSLHIHAMPSGQIGSGSVCANVRLNPGGFVR